jgi:hypothetical protein
MSGFSECAPSFRFINQNFVCVLRAPPTDNICWRAQIIRLRTVRYSPNRCRSLPTRTPCSQSTPSICSPLNATDRVSHSRTERSGIAVRFYTRIRVVLGSNMSKGTGYDDWEFYQCFQEMPK